MAIMRVTMGGDNQHNDDDDDDSDDVVVVVPPPPPLSCRVVSCHQVCLSLYAAGLDFDEVGLLEMTCHIRVSAPNR